MLTIAVIGCGQLGSRHLQALTHLSVPAQIYAVDPDRKSIEIAQMRVKEIVDARPEVKFAFYAEMSSIPPTIDIAIVATSSHIRAKVIEDLLSRTTVRYLILEKVLFQTVEEYAQVGALLKEKKIKAWVNCPRRMFPGYQWLLNELNGSIPWEIHVQGSTWGLASSCIHMIDAFSYLTGSEDCRIDAVDLASGLLPSKRDGFYEFDGRVQGFFDRGARFSISSFPSGSVPLSVQVTANSAMALVLEGESKAYLAREGEGWMWKEYSFHTLKQSEMTHLFVQDLVEYGTCRLPSYYTSAKLHLPMIQAFIQTLRMTTDNPTLERCLIT